MITNFKIFEATGSLTPPNFGIGDTVYCINNSGFENFLEIGKKYIIEDIEYSQAKKYYCRIKGYDAALSCVRFLNELEYTTNKYNL